MIICQQGKVKEIKNNILFIEIERHTACASCHAKTMCIPFDKKNEVISIPVTHPDGFQVGENIQLTLKQSMGTKAVIIAYLCPFLILSSGLFLIYYFTKNELLSVGVAFAATTLYFILLKRIDSRMKKRFTFMVNKNHE